MLQVRGTVVVDFTRFRLSDLAGAPICSADLTTLLENVLESVAELTAEPEQEHGHIAAKDRQFKFPQQVSQQAGRQAEALAEESRGLR